MRVEMAVEERRHRVIRDEAQRGPALRPGPAERELRLEIIFVQQ